MIELREPARASGATGRAARPRVIELVGPAAAGKTSLLRTLGELEPACRLGLRPPVLEHARSGLALLPAFAGLQRRVRRPLWKEMKRITYLRSLERAVASASRAPYRAIVMDEGPVYMLARMRVYGGAAIRTSAFQPWWRSTTEAWTRRLDAIVWLDAPDDVLAERLRTRDQSHRMRTAADAVVREFLGAYRTAYTEVIAALSEGSGVEVVSFRTDLQSPREIAASVGATFRRPGPSR